MLLAAFALPFISIASSNCLPATETEPITGWQLVLGEDPVIPTPQNTDALTAERTTERIETAVDSESDIARVEVAFILSTMLLAALFSVRAAAPSWFARFLLYGACLVVIGYVALMVSGEDSLSLEVRLHFGYLLGLIPVLGGLVVAFVFVRLARQDSSGSDWLSYAVFIPGLALWGLCAILSVMSVADRMTSSPDQFAEVEPPPGGVPRPNGPVTLTPSPPPQVGPNLLDNPSFEDGLSGWHITAEIDSSDSAIWQAGTDANRTVALGEETSPGNLGRLYQDVTTLVNADKRYVVRGWIRTAGVSGRVVIGISYVSPDGWTTSIAGMGAEVGYLSGNNAWAYYESQPFVLPPSPGPEATAVWLYVDFNDGTGTAWFDDLFLAEVLE